MNARALAYFSFHRLIGSSVEACYKEMLRLEGSSTLELARVQNERLEKLLHFAVQNVPFYRDRVPAKKNLALADFPILTKDDLKEYFLELMTSELRSEYVSGKHSRGYSWVKVQTGGSTGVPTTVIHDANYRDRGRAGRLYAQALCGFPLGTPYYRLWGSMQDINQARISRVQRILKLLHNEATLNAFLMDSQRMRSYLQVLSGSRTEHLMGYVDAVVQLAEFARDHKIPVRPLKSIMSCAGTLTEDSRRFLELAFGARVHNFYGSRECASIACECEHGGQHIFTNQVYLEIVDEEGRPVQTERSGRILLTLLQNNAFPLIRYEIGDVGMLSKSQCPCGRSFPILDRLEGRTAEFLRGTNGCYVSPVYIRHLIGVVHNPGVVRRFQLEQKSTTDFEFRYERNGDTSTEQECEVLSLIRRDLQAVLGNDSCLQIICVDAIPPTSSGKYLYTVNRVPGSPK